MKALWKDIVLADSDKAIQIEDDYFFPVESVRMDHLKKIGKTGYCKIKGNVCYYDVIADGVTLPEAAMSYDNPQQEAWPYRNYISFVKDIEIRK